MSFSPRSDSGTRLLVSVRSVAEAQIASSVGVAIIDIKEPRLGSLGRASSEVINEIARTTFPLQAGSQQPVLSVALGELSQLEQTDERELDELTELLSDPRVTFAKIGLACMIDHSDWRDRWSVMRERLHRTGTLHWIAVAYADAEQARSPSVDSVASAALATDAAGLLIDTYGKDGHRLPDYLSREELFHVNQQIQAAGLLSAFAGSLRAEDLPDLLQHCPPDVIAVRGAACSRHDRTCLICADAIQRLQRQLQCPAAGGLSEAAKQVSGHSGS